MAIPFALGFNLSSPISSERVSLGDQKVQAGQVDGELAGDGEQRVRVEDVGQRALLGERLEGLRCGWCWNDRLSHHKMHTYARAGDEEEAGGQQEALHGGLRVGELDAVQVEHALAVRQHQRVQRQDLEHLQRGDQRAAALLDHVAD